MILTEEEANKLNEKLVRVRHELAELGATSCIVAIVYEPEPNKTARSWTADGSFLEQVGLLTSLTNTFGKRMDSIYTNLDPD